IPSLLIRPPTSTTIFPYTTLFRSPSPLRLPNHDPAAPSRAPAGAPPFLSGSESTARPVPAAAPRRTRARKARSRAGRGPCPQGRSEEHTSELQSRGHLVCRLLLEK